MNLTITLSGLDGVGKTTQCGRIKRYFEEKYSMTGTNTQDLCNNDFNDDEDFERLYNKLKNYDVIVTRLYLSSNKTKKLKHKLLYESGFKNILLIKEVIKDVEYNARKYFNYVINPLLSLDNKIIIFDRFIYDEIAYRSLYGIDKHMLQQIFKDYPQADLRFLIGASLDTINQRNKEREDSQTRLYQNQEKVIELIENFKYVSQTYNMIEVNAEQDDISKDIIKEIEVIFR
ncbi:hypothetical protein [Clostridium thermarum]|uniref:hypothetical protein n=1 Tax=Clostridium thermarum TaxID=1716543 RepID=UPI0013D4B7E4|nr:hypothetical protein [Clostridium thermarum]